MSERFRGTGLVLSVATAREYLVLFLAWGAERKGTMTTN